MSPMPIFIGLSAIPQCPTPCAATSDNSVCDVATVFAFVGYCGDGGDSGSHQCWLLFHRWQVGVPALVLFPLALVGGLAFIPQLRPAGDSEGPQAPQDAPPPLCQRPPRPGLTPPGPGLSRSLAADVMQCILEMQVPGLGTPPGCCGWRTRWSCCIMAQTLHNCRDPTPAPHPQLHF